jgi:hypothetical protein
MRLPQYRLYHVMIAIVLSAFGLAVVRSIDDDDRESIRMKILDLLPPTVTLLLGSVLVSIAVFLTVKALPYRLRARLLGPLVVLAIGAIVAWEAWMGNRSERFQELAMYHYQRTPHGICCSLCDWSFIHAMRERWERQSPERNAWHAAQWRKYERAVRWPWLPVEPDAPEPD